ncbi:MAG: DUF429 domain-containing protein [Ignavibacteriae bacterium]|nr:DUF429 domain-containing protein [Ignavibacteriota bacterium]
MNKISSPKGIISDTKSETLIIGIDLAWGNKKPDGVCFMRANKRSAHVDGFAYPQGDSTLIELLEPWISRHNEVFITIDAPIICLNKTGTRPVDRLTHRMFHREHAACHPANLTKCPRPPKILKLLCEIGMKPGWKIGQGIKTAAEVYPHPAMVRLFRLERIIKYKKGRVHERRNEFQRLQKLMKKCLREHFSNLRLDEETTNLLSEDWNKPVEDLTDALFCALIGLWHWHHRGDMSEVIGNLTTGFILLPKDLRAITT